MAKRTIPASTNEGTVLGRRALLLGAASLAACASPPTAQVSTATIGDAPPAPSADRSSRPATRDWVVGVFATMTGPESALSVPVLDGIRLAVDGLDAAPPKGRKIRIRYVDDKGDAGSVVSAVGGLADTDDVVAIIGGVASSFARVAAAVADARKIPLLVCAATHPLVTQDNPYAFRTCFTDPFQARAAAEWAVGTAKRRRIAILSDPSDYATSLATGFMARAKDLGGLVVGDPRDVRSDASGIVDGLRADKVDLVYAPIFHPDAIRIAQAARAKGMSMDLFLGSDGWSVPELYPWIEGAAYTEHFVEDAPGVAASTFVGAYRARFDDAPGALAALGYDSVRLLADALARATDDTREGVRAALASTSDFAGASGRLRLGADHETEKDVFIARVRDGAPRYESTAGPFADGSQR